MKNPMRIFCKDVNEFFPAFFPMLLVESLCKIYNSSKNKLLLFMTFDKNILKLQQKFVFFLISYGFNLWNLFIKGGARDIQVAEQYADKIKLIGIFYFLIATEKLEIKH